MAKDLEPNHLRAWREHRKMTQEELAEAVDTVASVISLLENGERGLSSKWLRRLAPALGTTPGFLLDHDPEDVPGELLRTWADIDDDQRKQALTILKTFKRSA